MLNTIVLTALGTGFVALTLSLIWAISANLRQGGQYYQSLAERMQELRLAQALEMFGTDPNRYLYSMRVVDIERHMRNCTNCQDTRRCDVCLAAADSGERFSFCPNYSALRQI